MKIGIIGAGPAGLACAYRLITREIKSDVYEAGSSVGGLAKSIRLWNQTVDLGPHRFFSSDRRVNELWLEVVGSDYSMVDRLTRILYKGKLYRYPLRPADVVGNLGLRETLLCLLSYFRECVTPGAGSGGDETFESWVVKRFGRRLYEIFFKTYSEKLWGIPCHELDADFAVQRIKKFSLSEALKSAVFGDNGKKHKTLVDRFAYPHGGTGMVYERMAFRVSDSGGAVYLNTPVKRVVNDGLRVRGLELMDGTVKEYDHVVSTMPVTQLVSRLEGVDEEVKEAARSLRFRNTILVYLRVRSGDLFPDNWIYVHSPELRFGRLTNFRNWSSSLYGDEEASILALEYWCNEGDEIWGWEDERLVGLAKEEVSRAGLVKADVASEGYVHRISKCYPVYGAGYKRLLKPVEDYLGKIEGLTVIGRYGSFKYNNQDHSILMGILAADNIALGAENDLWAVNTDYEYQESAVITETGLVAGVG
ncbi:MAG TPA: FAD-dependent oxidoreductase [Thermodesulfobacteriota bacterium]|nr:FAD-dependent oxidoreductase [Thermodesulfobacteriota bacterium]